MNTFEILAVLLTICASFAYVNHRWIRLPTAIGLMAISLTTSTALILVDLLGWLHIRETAVRILERISFGDTLLHGMLGVLLFAGSLHIDIQQLRQEKLAVGILALGSTLLSTAAIAVLGYAMLAVLGARVPFGYCLLFGTVIAPTDPIGVLGILKQTRVPRSLEIQIAGESLFNDGVGVVLFLAVLGVVTRGEGASLGAITLSFAREAIGGALFGFASGYLTYRLLRSIDHYQTELLLTLALVLGGYAAAEHLHISAPIASVVSGLVIGNHGRTHGMSDVTRDHLDKFWSLMDEIFNAVLFVLVGFELIRLSLNGQAVVAGALMVVVVLVARFASVAVPVVLTKRWVRYTPGTIAVLTWGGLRGGISVALALSLPPGPERSLIVTMTYMVVVFSVLVQGLTLRRVVQRFVPSAGS